MDTDYEAFWSYTHEDDSRLAGYITRLADRIGDEYAVSSGDDLRIFLDRKSLEWGDSWREKITEALGSAPMFIAIVTPKFVRSAECRKELLSFVAEAKSRGFSKLLLPILLIDVPGLAEDSDDEVLALLARAQYVDWTKYRLMAESSSEVLTAVNSLALRIMSLQQEAQADVAVLEEQVDDGAEESVDQVFEQIYSLLPEWLEAVDFDPVARAQWNAAWIERRDRADRVFKQRRGVSGPFIAVWHKLGTDIGPLSQMRLREAKTYHRLTIALDPLVTAAFRLVEREPAFAPLFSDLADGVGEAMMAISESSPRKVWSYSEEPLRFSSKLKQAVENLHASEHFVDEANTIVSQWNDRLSALANSNNADGQSEGPQIGRPVFNKKLV